MNLSRLILLGRQVQPGDQGTMVDNVFLSLNKAFCHSVIQAGGVWWDGCVRWASRGVKLWLDDGAQGLCLVPSTLYFLKTIASGGGEERS